MQEYLEKNYRADMTEAESLSLALSALTEVIEAGRLSIEVAVVTKDKVEFLPEDRIAQEVKNTHTHIHT